jgi:rare lipoprotein A
VKLGIHKMGTAAVSLEVISAPIEGPRKWLQVSALSNKQSAKALQKKLQSLQQWPVIINTNKNRSLHKVRIGPIPEGQAIEQVLNLLSSHQLPKSLVLAAHQL